MIYIDSNVFIFAAFSEDSKGIQAREILKQVVKGDQLAATSSLTFDEVVWKLWKQSSDRDLAIDEGLKLASLRNLKVIEVDQTLIRESLSLMKVHKSLDPRDAIHLAAAIKVRCTAILTDDGDFDNIKTIKRRPLI